MIALLRWFGRLKKKPEAHVPSAMHHDAKPVAYVNCGRGIEFTADFIVGMTVAELVKWLKENFATRTDDEVGTYEWLPEQLLLSDGTEVGMDYTIRAGDAMWLTNPLLPSPTTHPLLK